VCDDTSPTVKPSRVVHSVNSDCAVLAISFSFKFRYKIVNSVPRPHRAHTAPSVRAPRRAPRAMHPITAALRGHYAVAGPGYIKARHGALGTRSDPPSWRHGCSRLQLFPEEYGRSRLLHPLKARKFSAFILARFGRSRLCLR